MNLSQGKLAGGMVQELLEVIYKYEDALILPTVLGILDIVKFQLIQDHMEEEDEDDDD
jgi:hypothetical protein